MVPGGPRGQVTKVTSADVRSRILAQALRARFFDDELWEWAEVAEWLLRTYLPLEERLSRARVLLGLEGATYVSWEDLEPDETTQVIVEGLGMRMDVRRNHGRVERVLTLMT
jgi:hypothetical protein